MDLRSSNEVAAMENFMAKAYNDTEFNIFENGIAPTECGKVENRRILLRNVPKKWTVEAIRRLLEKFGTVKDINIPKNQDSFNNEPGLCCVFAEFENFK